MAKLPRYLFPSDYMADPAAHVFNGKLYVYPSHDWEAGAAFDDDGGHFQMKDYHVLSFNDVENDDATDHGVILDVSQVPWAEKQMWDSDVVEKDGKYYLIFSAKDYNGVFHLGVAIADRPEGPFIPQEHPIRGAYSIDPCVFKDDDGQVPWVEKQMWDSDVVEKDGKYYLVYSAKDYNGEFHLGVAIADRPEGPFIPQEHPIRGAYSIDPCVFKDDDGQVYCYYGGLWGGQLQWNVAPNALCGSVAENKVDLGPAPDRKTQLYTTPDTPALPSLMARMSDDLLQFAEAPRRVLVVDKDGQPLKAGDPHRFFEASWMHKYNGKYYFSYSTGDSHYLCYAIGDNPYGPFTYQGVILEPVVGWTTHHCIVEYKGQWYLLYHDCVPSNDVTHLRSLKVQRLYYNEDGTIKPVVNE